MALPPPSCRLLSGRAEGVGSLSSRRPCPRLRAPTSPRSPAPPPRPLLLRGRSVAGGQAAQGRA
eukprot:735859-Alexandrium_andersonii.AAC.1